MKYIMVVLAMAFVIAGIPCWISNSIAGNAADFDDEGGDNYIINMSIGGHGSPSERSTTVPIWQSILHIIVMIIILLSYYWLRRF
jgi:hypothetical protein